MLCSQCHQIFNTVKQSSPGMHSGKNPELFSYGSSDNSWTGSHHIKAGSFRSAVESRCYSCYSIYRDCSQEIQALSDVFLTFYEISVTSNGHYALNFSTKILPGSAPGARRLVFDCVGTFPVLPREEIQVPREPLGLTQNTFSGKCEEQVRSWLNECSHEQAHLKCRQDWRTSHNFPFRLLKIKPDHLFLETFRAGDPLPKYVTMSHCWTSRSAVAIKLLRKTENSFRDGLPVSDLAHKFRNAVKIAQWMRVDYLWVDALCIIQDDIEDWRQQSSVMGEIYTGSYCNIAATNADPEAGCFTQRLVSIVEPHSIADPRDPTGHNDHIIGYDDFWCNSLLNSTLHTRAWVLQERLLSPRTIYFGQEQIFWECRGVMACEAYPAGIPKVFQNLRTRSWRMSDRILNPASRQPATRSAWDTARSWIGWQSPHPTQDLHWAYETWSRTVERYMECDLTFGHDKLVAISGITKVVAEVTGERYLAGHWENSLLLKSLLWFVPSRKQANSKPSVRSSVTKVEDYRAPWASVDAQVTWNWPAECGQNVAKVIDTIIDISEEQRFGAVAGARMRIEAQILPVELSIASQTEDGHFVENGSYTVRCQRRIPEGRAAEHEEPNAISVEPKIYLDTPMLPQSTVGVYLMPICRQWQGASDYTAASLAGLIVSKSAAATTTDVYERVGIFALDEPQADALFSSPVATPVWMPQFVSMSELQMVPDHGSLASTVPLKEHGFKGMNGDKYACKCLDLFTSKSNLTRHCRTLSKSAGLQCRHCEYSAPRSDNLIYHHKVQHPEKFYAKCVICGRWIYDPQHLAAHWNHKKGFQITCGICRMTFTNRDDYEDHMKRKHPRRH